MSTAILCWNKKPRGCASAAWILSLWHQSRRRVLPPVPMMTDGVCEIGTGGDVLTQVFNYSLGKPKKKKKPEDFLNVHLKPELHFYFIVYIVLEDLTVLVA